MSSSNTRFLPVENPVERIFFVDEVVRTEACRFRSESTPHHLVHVTLSGEVTQWAEGRPVSFRGGDIIWYHGGEPVEGEILQAPWHFFTVGFSASRLSPPPDDQRVRSGGPNAVPLARRLLTCWRDTGQSGLERSLRCTALLLELILDVAPLSTLPPPVATYPQNARDRWWSVEKRLRHQLEDEIDLAGIAGMAGMSVRTVNRACKAATGMSPVQRFRELRLMNARGLLQYTDLAVTEIALRSGYSRVQDFSRDFKKRFSRTPSHTRQSGPDHQQFRAKEALFHRTAGV